jgi:hypothetical protein
MSWILQFSVVVNATSNLHSTHMLRLIQTWHNANGKIYFLLTQMLWYICIDKCSDTIITKIYN